MNMTDLSDRELLVMKCLWDASAPMTVGDLIDKIHQEYGIAYKETTVYTFLKRLKDKNYVTSYKRGSSHFKPAVDENEFLHHYAETMSAFWGRDASNVFLGTYAETQGYTAEEWKSLLKG